MAGAPRPGGAGGGSHGPASTHGRRMLHAWLFDVDFQLSIVIQFRLSLCIVLLYSILVVVGSTCLLHKCKYNFFMFFSSPTPLSSACKNAQLVRAHKTVFYKTKIFGFFP